MLVDEPDAHMEHVMQKEIYNVISDVVEETGGQLLIATHSEAILKRALQKDGIITFFIGTKPKIFDIRDRNAIDKALQNIPLRDWYRASQQERIYILKDRPI